VHLSAAAQRRTAERAQAMNDQKTTHFGFEQVAVEKKAERVADVFHPLVEAFYD
jgi:hypothetical protein